MTLHEIENTYGADLAEEIKERIESANEIGIDHKIEVVEEGRIFHVIAFSTWAYVHFFEIHLKTGRVVDVRKIGYTDCKKALELMGRCGRSENGGRND